MSPQRLLLLVGVPLGLLIAFLAPAWIGYDEPIHFARAVDMAGGSLFATHEEGLGTPIPASYSEDTLLVQQNWVDGNPAWTAALTGDLLGSSPDGRTVHVDLRPLASPPVAYLPAAVGMLVPVAVDAPGVLALWAGRIANLAAYLSLAVLAVRTASAFRWTLAALALLPMHLTLGATISPDALTAAALFLVVALWTRVRADEEIPLWLLVSGTLLLALAKPPYFLVLALLPVAGFRRRTPEGRLAARVGAGTLGLGLLVTLLNSSAKFQAEISTMGYGDVDLQPEVQRERLLGDLPGFVWASVETWFTELDHYVQAWFRHIVVDSFFPSDLPGLLSWSFLFLLVAALLRLDRKDFRGLRGSDRWLVSLGAVGMLLLLYTTSYVYFTDHVDYDTIGEQMARYSAPLLVLMVLGWAPRWVGRSVDRLPVDAARIVLAVIPVLATAAILLTWLVTGTIGRN